MNVTQFYPIYQQCKSVVIDNRNLKKDDIFFAFSGENFDAATRANQAIEDGALAVIVENPTYENPEKNIYYVPSTLEFLQALAKYHRQQLDIPIIGLTGSNGKTTTKELIATVLSKKFSVQFTKGNLNNHIGVPLTLLSIRPEHEIAVVEMGANHQKEIELLCSITQPTLGYITNFGKAHLEGFGGFEGVIKGKSELYDYLKSEHKTIIVNENDAIQVEKTKDYPKTITFGSPTSEFNFELFYQHNQVGIKYHNQTALTQLTGAYNFTNISVAVALGLYFNIDFEQIKEAIETYEPTNMRSQIMQKHGKTLVLDTYNANPSSMALSLENFSKFDGTKTIIIGDMLELGEFSKQEHEQILNLANNLAFEQIITVGPCFKQVNQSSLAFENTQDLSIYLQQHPINAKNILLKGSRGIGLEKVIDNIK